MNNSLEMPKICFGTGSTFPITFSGGLKKSLINCVKFIRNKFIQKNKEAMGRTATTIAQATKALIPIARLAPKYGITAFDCARAYGGSERRLAIALKSYNRKDVFIITKIDDSSQFSGKVKEGFDKSLSELRTDYVDLLLLHWPVDYPPFPNQKESIPVYVKSWKILEQIYKIEKARMIGVSNFNIKHLEQLKKSAEILPMANEFECHPLATRPLLTEYCSKNNIKVLAYGSLGTMDRRLQIGSIVDIAKRYGKSIAQVILKWHIQHGRIPIFRTSKVERIKEYGDLDFELSLADLKSIDAYNINFRIYPASEKIDFTKGVWIGHKAYKENCPDEI